MIKFGYNIDAGSIEDFNYLSNVLREGKYKAHLLMTGSYGVDQAKTEMQKVANFANLFSDPQTRLIHRRYSGHEGNWRKFNVEDEARRWEVEGQKHIIRQDPANEPGDTDNAEYVKSRIRLLELAYNLGITVCVGTWGVGGPHESYIENGVYDELLAALARYGGMLDVHEYIPIMPEFGSIYGYEMLLDPTQYRNLEVNTPWPVAKQHWIGRRLDNWLLRADAIKVKRPLINISEVLWDKIPDAETKLNNQGGKWDAFQKKYSSGNDFNGDVRGVLSLAQVLKAAYPELTYPQALFRTWRRWYETLYENRPEVFSTQAFQWGHLWRFPETHDWSYKVIEPFIWMVSDYSKVRTPGTPTPDPVPPTPVPEVPMTPAAVKSTATSWTNIRKEPKIKGTPIGRLPNRLRVQLSKEPIKGESYGASDLWYKIQIGSITGYIAATWIDVDREVWDQAISYEEIIPPPLAQTAEDWHNTDPREFDQGQIAQKLEDKIVWGMIWAYVIFILVILLVGAVSTYYGWGA